MNRFLLILLLCLPAMCRANVNSTNRFNGAAGVNSITRFMDYPPAVLSASVNSIGKFPDFSAGSAPSAPSGLSVVSVDGTGVTLGWTDNSADETGFWVEFYDGINGPAWLPPASDSDSDPSPAAAGDTAFFAGINSITTGGSQFELSFIKFRVFATNDSGASTYSAEVQVPPSVMVTDLDAVVLDVDDIELTWTDTGENKTGVNIYRSANGGMTYSLIATEDVGDDEYYVDTDVLLSFLLMNLRYKLVLVNSGGSGPDSNIATPHL